MHMQYMFAHPYDYIHINRHLFDYNKNLCMMCNLQFEEYKKMIYMDADIQVFENIDHLFDTPDGYFYATMDCFCEKTWSHSLQFKVGYCQQCPDRMPWPVDMGSPPPLYFNAGMFVFNPGRSTFDKLLEVLYATSVTPFAEQVSSSFFIYNH